MKVTLHQFLPGQYNNTRGVDLTLMIRPRNSRIVDIRVKDYFLKPVKINTWEAECNLYGRSCHKGPHLRCDDQALAALKVFQSDKFLNPAFKCKLVSATKPGVVLKIGCQKRSCNRVNRDKRQV